MGIYDSKFSFKGNTTKKVNNILPDKGYSSRTESLNEVNCKIEEIRKYLLLTRDLIEALDRLGKLYEEKGWYTDGSNPNHRFPDGLRMYEVREIYERTRSKFEKMHKRL